MHKPSNPFEEIARLFDHMGRQISDASRGLEEGEPFGRWPLSPDSMAVDVVERDDEFVVTVDLPGFDRDDVDVQVTDRTLRIEAEREDTTDEEDGRYVRHERRARSLDRSVRLPEAIAADGVEATMNNGVLSVTLPKLEVEEAREIRIG